MQSAPPTVHMLCGKIAAGKSTLAARLSAGAGTVLISEDAWLDALFADELQSREDYVRCSRRIRAAMTPHVVALLRAGMSVVLDFPANTPGQRRWLKDLVEISGAAHALHVLDVPDEVCLARLHARNTAGEHPFTVSDDLFHEMTRSFTQPAPDEGFVVIRHRDGGRDGPEAPGP